MEPFRLAELPRPGIKKRGAKLATAILLLNLLCGVHAYASEVAPVTLTWGADANSGAPYVFANPADLSQRIGFECDIMAAIGRDMNQTPQFVQNNWDSLIPGLQRGLYEVVINGLEITPEHQAAVDFSRPYYTTFEQLVVRTSTKKNINDLQDLNGLTVGTLDASLAQRILQKFGKAEVKTYDDAINAYTDLESGRVDAVLMDAPIAIYYATPRPDLKFVGAPIGTVAYGIAVRKGAPQLLAQLNLAIGEITQSGQLHTILSRWNLWNSMTALQTGDNTTSTVEPVAYNSFMTATRTGAKTNSGLDRYLTFLPLIGRGAILTIEISILSMAIAVSLGLILALCRGYARMPLTTLAAAYVECVRGTPLLIQILFIFYALPSFGIRLNPFFAGTLALGLNYAAYEAENYRAGLEAVPKGQMEAAIALNMTRFQSLRYVIVPQAIRIVLPTVTNDFISLIKDSSLVSVITLVELTQVYMQLSTTYYDYLVPGLLVAGAYLLLGIPFIFLARWMEHHLAVEVSGKPVKRGITP
jgi:polar amino acid transport system substrate-binding protein